MQPSGSTVVAPKLVTPDLTKRNIALGFDLLEAILDDPAILDQIPNGITLILLPSDDPELFESNIALGLEAAREGRDVLFRHIVASATDSEDAP